MNDPVTASGVRLGAIDHVGIAVSDLDAALRLYTEVLGWVVSHRETNVEQGVTEVMLVRDEALSSPPGTGASQVQLLAPLHADTAVGRFLARRGPGLHHVAYQVDNVAEAENSLSHAGLRLLYAVSKAGTRGSLINFVHPKDAGGTLIELVEPAADTDPGLAEAHISS